ncbi:MAG: folylpolyglutamate synthase/dihydrofolate synthase family protein, partial [Flavobacteriaceae bacterium]
MNYQETLDFLYSQLPVFQRDGAKALELKLYRTLQFMHYLGEPHKAFKSVHVAGTNGKGSVSHMTASVLQHAGYKVGLYTSPHLKDFRERIRIDGDCITEDKVIGFVESHRLFIEEFKPSFFELTVAMAFDHFASQAVDIAVIEVGMGGRLDSTNVITPLLSVITNISYDHKAFLGDTLPKIAFEKAGIIKPRIPVVIGEYQEETFPVFQRQANAMQSELIKAYEQNQPQWFLNNTEFDLQGPYQQKNRLTVITLIQGLIAQGWEINEQAIEIGMKNAAQSTGLMGRWQWIESRVLCDTAHNAAGLAFVLKRLGELKYRQLHIVLGVVSDKDLDEILPLFPKSARYYFVAPNINRALPAEVLKNQAQTLGLIGDTFTIVSSGLAAAKEVSSPYDQDFVGGS